MYQIENLFPYVRYDIPFTVGQAIHSEQIQVVGKKSWPKSFFKLSSSLQRVKEVVFLRQDPRKDTCVVSL